MMGHTLVSGAAAHEWGWSRLDQFTPTTAPCLFAIRARGGRAIPPSLGPNLPVPPIPEFGEDWVQGAYMLGVFLGGRGMRLGR